MLIALPTVFMFQRYNIEFQRIFVAFLVKMRLNIQGEGGVIYHHCCIVTLQYRVILDY